jgi:hypothetical protein
MQRNALSTFYPDVGHFLQDEIPRLPVTTTTAFAWLALFDNHIDDDSIKAGQQANLLSKNPSFGDLHMLACLYAAQGKTTEARQLLLDAMTAGNQAEPNPAVWFGISSIYEQLGLDEAAIAASVESMCPTVLFVQSTPITLLRPA